MFIVLLFFFHCILLELAGHPYIYVHMHRIYINNNIYIYTPRAFMERMDIKASLFIWKSIGKRIGIDGNRDKVTRKQFLQREYRYRRELHRLSSNHQFMWSINHNLSNTVASYTVHREAIVAPQKLKGLVSWTTHSGCHTLRGRSKAFRGIE